MRTPISRVSFPHDPGVDHINWLERVDGVGQDRWFESIRAYHFKSLLQFLHVISYLCCRLTGSNRARCGSQR